MLCQGALQKAKMSSLVHSMDLSRDSRKLSRDSLEEGGVNSSNDSDTTDEFRKNETRLVCSTSDLSDLNWVALGPSVILEERTFLLKDHKVLADGWTKQFR